MDVFKKKKELDVVKKKKELDVVKKKKELDVVKKKKKLDVVKKKKSYEALLQAGLAQRRHVAHLLRRGQLNKGCCCEGEESLAEGRLLQCTRQRSGGRCRMCGCGC